MYYYSSISNKKCIFATDYYEYENEISINELFNYLFIHR